MRPLNKIKVSILIMIEISIVASLKLLNILNIKN